MHNVSQPFNSWGLVLLMLGIGIVLCIADSWNGQPEPRTNTNIPREVQR